VKAIIDEQRRVFADSPCLLDESRKSGYKDIIEFTRKWVLNLPDNYGSHLKDLYFKGVLPSQLEFGLGKQEPFFICLCAPVIDQEFVIETFNLYKPGVVLGLVQDYRVKFDGRDRGVAASVIERYREIVEYLADDRANWLCGYGEDYRPTYLRFYAGMFSALAAGNQASLYVGSTLISYVEGIFEEIYTYPDYQDCIDSLRSSIRLILSGRVANPDVVYQDPVLVGFLQRFFDNLLPSSLQAIVDVIYQGISSGLRIRFVGGMVIR
jgi:hypothetical protein